MQEQDRNPLQSHNCTFHLQLVSIFGPISCQHDMTTVTIRDTDHVCLCCEKHFLIHGLATAVVNSIENSWTQFPSSSFCSHVENSSCLLFYTSLCLAICGHPKTSDGIAQDHIIFSCGHCFSSFGKSYTTIGKTGIPLIKNSELHFGLTPVLLKLGRC